jgi:tRNA threonylcarbamoyladenosine biosynthesis protein TsaE
MWAFFYISGISLKLTLLKMLFFLQSIFYHFDFYRVDDPEEVIEIGIDEYFYSGKYCWIEWAEKIPAYIPKNFLFIEIKVNDDESRSIGVKHV